MVHRVPSLLQERNETQADSEAEADLLSVSHAMWHARPSITLDKYGHLSKKGLAPLMGKIDALVAPLVKVP